MLAQLAGAVVRAFVVLVVVATPFLLIPGTTADAAQIVMLIGLSLAVFVASEYAATFPGLIEFRDAPPFNRIRILSLFATLFMLSLIANAEMGAADLPLLILAMGKLSSNLFDVPDGPIATVLSGLPDPADPLLVAKIRAMMGVALIVAVLTMILIVLLVRVQGWPHRAQAFNVWVNLPTFDPTTGGDIIRKLRREGRVNLILAVLSFVLERVWPERIQDSRMRLSVIPCS